MNFLPLKLKLVDSLTSQHGGLSVLDVMRHDDVSHAYHVMRKAAEQGDNVGLDEYANEKQFHDRLDVSRTFAVKSRGTIQAVIMIGPCRIARGIRPCLCEIQIFVSRELFPHCASILNAIIPACERIAVSLNLNYTGCVIQLSVANSDWLKKLKELDYVVTACLPRCVDIKGQGLIDSFVLYKRLQGAATVKKERNADILTNVSTLPEVMANSLTEEEYRKCILPKVPGLPYLVRERDLSFLMRELRPGEDKVIYDWLMDHARRGVGYSMADFPTLGFFRRKLITSYVFVSETESGEVTAAYVFRPSPFVRHNRGDIWASMGFSNPVCRKKAMSAPTFSSVRDRVVGGFACKELLGTCIASQFYPLKLNMELQYTQVGSLPDGIYVIGQGWQDIVFFTADMNLGKKAFTASVL